MIITSLYGMNYMIITSLYGMNYTPDTKQQRAYEKKRQAAIELLGDKYLLAQPVEKKEESHEKSYLGYFTSTSLR